MDKKITTIIGIDPGIKGGIAAIRGSDIVFLELMPTARKQKLVVDPVGVYDLIKDLNPEKTKVYIEKVNAMPNQGVTSMFNFGKGFGTLIGVFESHGFKLTYVTPQMWKANMLGRGNKDKKLSIDLAKTLFPGIDLKPGRKITDQDGMAEALLIAVYGGKKTWR
jgi:crossover junction endodeoxyribonuclease RuvC